MAIDRQFGWCLVGSYPALPPVVTETDTDRQTDRQTHTHTNTRHGYVHCLCRPQNHPVLFNL